MKTEDEILSEVIKEKNPSAMISGELDWDTCIEAIIRFSNQLKSGTQAKEFKNWCDENEGHIRLKRIGDNRLLRLSNKNELPPVTTNELFQMFLQSKESNS